MISLLSPFPVGKPAAMAARSGHHDGDFFGIDRRIMRRVVGIPQQQLQGVGAIPERSSA